MDAPAWEHAGEKQSAIHKSEAEGVQCEDEAEGVDDCGKFSCEYEL